jgi:hypothetical protein
MREGRACDIGEYQTDARVMHVRTRFGRVAALDLVDARHALALADGRISIAASEPVSDLHMRLAEGLLYLATSQPPGQLRVEADNAELVIDAEDWIRSPSETLFRFGAPFALDEVAPGRCEDFCH